MAASAHGWPWRPSTQDAAKHASSPRHGRHWFQLLVMAGAGLTLHAWLGHRLAAAVVWSLAGLLLLGLLGVPGILAGFDRFGKGLAWLIGTALTWILLAPFYWIVFGIGHLLLRLSGRDPMNRRHDPALATYWITRQERPPAQHFRRQF